MVAGGFSTKKEIVDATGWAIKDDQTGEPLTRQGYINDVELLSLSKGGSKCSKFVKPIYEDKDATIVSFGDDENGYPQFKRRSEAYGLTGIFSKGAAIVCGGINFAEFRNTCYEWDSNINK